MSLMSSVSAEHSKKIAFTAPHWAATDTGLSILREGGTATEAMVAAAAVVSVVYPHMNSIGGDGFWLIHNLNDQAPIAIDACGRSAANLQQYANGEIPNRGGLAAITQAGTIRGWQQALEADQQATLPLSRLMRDAIAWAENGITVTHSLQMAVEKLLAEPTTPDAFKALYAPNGKAIQAGDTFKNPELASTFKALANSGLGDFYQGELADKIAKSLAAASSPLTLQDLQETAAAVVKPLSVSLEGIRCFNLPAPTQGVHSLQILSMVDRLKSEVKTDAEWAHLIVEATKQSFADRAEILADEAYAPAGYFSALTEARLAEKTQKIDLTTAQPWPFVSEHGDTIWMGARDAHGQLVSFIQSIYWEFGSAVLIEDCGFVWNNRGTSFSLDANDINVLQPKKKPRHTLNPALALFDSGERLSYGTMGGEGQPQTQATLFSRYVWQGKSLEQAISQGRWLLGRTWGDASNDLKVEADIAEHIGEALRAKHHQWQRVEACNEMMGHAGAIADKGSELTAATDPRSDGHAAAELVD